MKIKRNIAAQHEMSKNRCGRKGSVIIIINLNPYSFRFFRFLFR